MSGLQLARDYACEVVGPLMDRKCTNVPRSVARIGSGSDVLGLDDAMSQDHDWGLRLQVFVDDERIAEVTAVFAHNLPEFYAGLPTHFAFSGQDAPRCGVDVLSVAEFIDTTIGFDPRGPATASDWMSLSGQAALEVTAGEVFEDAGGQLADLRGSLTWYPHPVWQYVVACDWQRLDQELPLLGRADDRGDRFGARLIAARLADVVVHLSFMLSRVWPPYPKWRGTLFAALPLPACIREGVADFLESPARQGVERLTEVLRVLASVQGSVGLASTETPCIPFWDRPYRHIDPKFLAAQYDAISDPQVESLPHGLGGIDQLTDNVDLLTDVALRRRAVGSSGMT